MSEPFLVLVLLIGLIVDVVYRHLRQKAQRQLEDCEASVKERAKEYEK